MSRQPTVSCQQLERALFGRLDGVPGRAPPGVPGRLDDGAGDGEARAANRLGGLPVALGAAVAGMIWRRGSSGAVPSMPCPAAPNLDTLRCDCGVRPLLCISFSVSVCMGV